MLPVILTYASIERGTTPPASVDGLRRVVDTALIGAREATAEDQQRKIDRTAVGICAATIWTKAECEKHGEGR